MLAERIIFVDIKKINMEIIFDKEYLRDLYTSVKSDNNHRLQLQIIVKYILIIVLIL